jgi:hypothetical protein
LHKFKEGDGSGNTCGGGAIRTWANPFMSIIVVIVQCCAVLPEGDSTEFVIFALSLKVQLKSGAVCELHARHVMSASRVKRLQ